MVFSLLLAAGALVAPAASASPTAPPEIVHVVTSDRSDETLRNTVRTTYVVTAAEIAREGYQTVADAIATIPGVQIAAYGPIGASAQYGIRGSASTQVLVLVDGQPAPGQLGDSVQLGTFSTAGVARIEVVEGGGSTLYGTGAIGGIINIITDSQHAPAGATLRYGTFDDREIAVNADGFSLQRVVSNNAYALPASAGAFGPNPSVHDNDDYEATAFRFGRDQKLGALVASFHASLESDDLGAAGLFPDYSTTSREHDVNDGGTFSLSDRRVQSTASLSLFGSSQQITFACDEAADADCYQSNQSLDDETRNGLSLRDIVNGNDERTIYGIDFSRGVVSTNDGNGDPVASYALAQSAAYAQQTWTNERGELYAGLRGERDGSLGGEFSPSLGARVDLGGGLTLKFNAATAFRAPNATELYYPYYGNPALHPERAQVGDVTLDDATLLGGTSLGWFVNDTRDLIVPTCVADCNPLTAPPNTYPVYEPENVDHAHIAGLTFDTRTKPLHGIAMTLNATDLYLADDLDTVQRLPDDPVFTVNLGLQYTGGSRALIATAGVSERAVGQRAGAGAPIDPTQPLFYQPVAYANLTAFASFRIAPRALLTVRGSNLGNERYAEVAGYPMPGRTLAIELSTR